MTRFRHFLAVAACTVAFPAFGADLTIQDPYIRTSGATASSGAAFFVIENSGPTDDRLIAATSDIAARVELHTHIQDATGVMQMVEVPEGFVIPAGGQHVLARGGDHVMFLGLTRPLQDGERIAVTLTFETAGEITVDIPVDSTRKPMHGQMKHGQMQGAATE